MKITMQMRRMVRDQEYAKVVAQMVAAEDALRAYEQRHRVPTSTPYRNGMPEPKLVKRSNAAAEYLEATKHTR